MTPEQREELLALGALGALPPDEIAELDELLATDPDAAGELARFRDAVALLAEARSERPPAALREKVLGTPAAARPEPAPSRRRVPVHHRRWMIPATAAAAVIALLVAGLVISRDADAPGDDMVAAVLEDEERATLPLSGAAGELSLVKSDEVGATVLMGHDIVAPEAGLVYQLWELVDGEAHDMGTFMPSEEGDVAMVMDGVSPSTRYAVTVEPAGGSDRPTGDHVAESPDA